MPGLQEGGKMAKKKEKTCNRKFGHTIYGQLVSGELWSTCIPLSISEEGSHASFETLTLNGIAGGFPYVHREAHTLRVKLMVMFCDNYQAGDSAH